MGADFWAGRAGRFLARKGFLRLLIMRVGEGMGASSSSNFESENTPEESRVVSQRGSPVTTWLTVKMLLEWVGGACRCALERCNSRRDPVGRLSQHDVWRVVLKVCRTQLTSHGLVRGASASLW